MQTVLVVLGIPKSDEGPMPATITTWPKPRRSAFQYLSPDQLKAMDGDQTALWEATLIEGHWWLEHRLPNPDTMGAIESAWRRTPVEIDPREIPF